MITFCKKFKFFMEFPLQCRSMTQQHSIIIKKLSEIEFFHRLLLQKTKTKREK